MIMTFNYDTFYHLSRTFVILDMLDPRLVRSFEVCCRNQIGHTNI